LYIDAHGQCGQKQGYKDLCYIWHVWHPGLHFFSDLQFSAVFSLESAWVSIMQYVKSAT
jgi:hypothetical protein